jgi:hypothetical protein
MDSLGFSMISNTMLVITLHFTLCIISYIIYFVGENHCYDEYVNLFVFYLISISFVIVIFSIIMIIYFLYLRVLSLFIFISILMIISFLYSVLSPNLQFNLQLYMYVP